MKSQTKPGGSELDEQGLKERNKTRKENTEWSHHSPMNLSKYE